MTRDIIGILKNVLSTQWNAANTDGRKPDIYRITEFNKVNLDDADFVSIAQMNYIPRNNAIGNLTKETEDNLQIKVASNWLSSDVPGELHIIKMKEEIERIIETNSLDLENECGFLEITNITDANNSSLKRWGYNMEIKETIFNTQKAHS